MPRLDDRSVAGIAATTTALVTIAGGGATWLVLVLACYAAGVSYGVRDMLSTLLAWRLDLRLWSRSLVTERVADRAHRSTRGAEQPLQVAARFLESRGDPEGARVIRDGFARCRTRARETLAAWRESARPELAEAAEEGYLGGATLAAQSRSSTPLRRFATFDNTPHWLPRTLRAWLVRGLRGIDVVRVLHTPQIERRSLIVSLWLRAVFVLVAPIAGGASLTDFTPFGDETGAVADVVYVVVAGFSVATALLAPRIADYTIGQPTRMPLVVAEQGLTVLAVVASPCWPIAIFGAGAVNWIERPDWTLRRLLVWMGLTYVPFAAAAALRGASAGDVALEIAIAIAITALMAGSYGLMFPATATTFVGAIAGSAFWRLRAFLTVDRDTRRIGAVLQEADNRVRALRGGDPEADRVLEGLARARRRLDDPRQLLRRRSRVLGVLCSQAITAIVPPEGGGTGEATLRAAQIVPDPPTVGTLILNGNAVARRLERIIKRVALEAIDNGGEGLLLCHLGLLEDGRITIEIANGLPSDERDRSGFGTGGEWLTRWCAGIPGCKVLDRDFADGQRLHVVFRVFTVRLAIGPVAFQEDEADGAHG